MSEMIERVARAICKAQQCDPDALEPGDFPQIDGHKANGDPAHFLWRNFVIDARAAIDAMRVPTDAMLTVAVKGGFPLEPAGSQVNRPYVWQAMIDAALSKKPEDVA